MEAGTNNKVLNLIQLIFKTYMHHSANVQMHVFIVTIRERLTLYAWKYMYVDIFSVDVAIFWVYIL